MRLQQPHCAHVRTVRCTPPQLRALAITHRCGKIDKDNETIASSKRFSWSVQDLNALENSLADIVTKKLCLASEYEVTYHNPLAFGRPEDVLIDKGGLSVIQTNDHKR